ncbi:hypothetical protein R6Q57_001043 [Mikania cordata]
MTTTAPILVSKNDILCMFQQVQQQMIDQQWMNQRLIREMENLKAEKNKQVEVTTPITPRILDFGTSGISGNHSGDFIPMQTGIGTSSGSQDLGISRDNLLIPRTSLPTPLTTTLFELGHPLSPIVRPTCYLAHENLIRPNQCPGPRDLVGPHKSIRPKH